VLYLEKFGSFVAVGAQANLTKKYEVESHLNKQPNNEKGELTREKAWFFQGENN